MIPTGTAASPQAHGSAAAERATPKSVDSVSFRLALGRLAAGVSVITTVGRGGQKIGLTATAVTSLSVDPPLVLACIGNWSRAIAALEEQAPFIIHLLGAEQRSLAQHFATTQPDKFDSLPHRAGIGGSPRLPAALAWIECVTHALHPAGDHTIVIGRVVATQLGHDRAAPLVYFRREYHGLEALAPAQRSP